MSMLSRFIICCLLFCISLVQGFSQSAVAVTDLRCESVTAPLGIDVAKPHLSWRLESSTPGQRQTAYHVLVASSAEKLNNGSGDLWDSGKIVSSQSQHVAYEGMALSSKQAVHWRVRIWGQDGQPSNWSSPAQWTMGLLSPEDWNGQWIARSLVELAKDEIIIQSAQYQTADQSVVVDVKDAVKKFANKGNGFKVQYKSFGLKKDIASGQKKELVVDYTKNGKPETLRVAEKKTASFVERETSMSAIHFLKEFNLERVPDAALFTVNSLFMFEVYVNGQKVGDDVLTPAISNTESRSFSVSYDLKPLLKAGNNCVGIWLGPNPLHFTPISKQFAVRAQLDLITNGEARCIGTDATWLTQESGHSSYATGRKHFGGEQIDARKLIPDWSQPGLNTGTWSAALAVMPEESQPISVNQSCPLNRIGMEIPAKAVTQLEDNKYAIDMGTALTGWFRIQLPQLNAGDKVTMSFADVERDSKYQTFGQMSQFISAGKPGEVFQNKFSYMGYRYVIVEGLPSAPALSDAVGLLVESDLEQTGAFECSNDLLNRIFYLNEWTLRCLNLGGYTVDCPHRERKGYGGDGQVPIEGFMTSFRSDGFYRKWLVDWQQVQKEDGSLPNVAPKAGGGGGPGWGGFVAAATWRHYLYYGDLRVVAENWDTVRNYVEYMEAISEKNGDILTGRNSKFSFIGDWVAPGRGMSSDNLPTMEAKTFFNNCYRIYHLQLYINMAQALGKSDVAAKYQQVIERIRPIIHAEFYDAAQQHYVIDEQGYYLMALMSGVVPETLRETILTQLEQNILETSDGHFGTGLLGTYFMMEYLREIGRSDLVFTMATQTTYPSWGYMLEQGGTTVWEQWNGKFSQMHSCFPSANNWLYQSLGGIQADPNAPGFQNVIIKPDMVGDVTWVKTHYDSVKGRIISHWMRDDGTLTMNVTIPPGSTGTVYVPAQSADAVRVNGAAAANEAQVTLIQFSEGRAAYAVASGSYTFSSRVN